MNVLGWIVVGWLGFNVAFVVIRILTAPAAVPADVHDILDDARDRKP